MRALAMLVALAACGHAEDPAIERSKQFCRAIAVNLDLAAKHVEAACAAPAACAPTDGHEENVRDPEIRVAIELIRNAMQLDAVHFCAPQVSAECPIGDYACLVRVGHAVGKAVP